MDLVKHSKLKTIDCGKKQLPETCETDAIVGLAEDEGNADKLQRLLEHLNISCGSEWVWILTQTTGAELTIPAMDTV